MFKLGSKRVIPEHARKTARAVRIPARMERSRKNAGNRRKGPASRYSNWMFSGVMTLAVKSSAASALISLLSQSGRSTIRPNCTITKPPKRHRVLAFEFVFRFDGPLDGRRSGVGPDSSRADPLEFQQPRFFDRLTNARANRICLFLPSSHPRCFDEFPIQR